MPDNEFGSLDSLTSVTTFSYIPCRDQREREEDIYEVKPPTLVLRKKKKVPALPEMFILQQAPNTLAKQQNYWPILASPEPQQIHDLQKEPNWQHKTCIRCHRPKMIRWNKKVPEEKKTTFLKILQKAINSLFLFC